MKTVGQRIKERREELNLSQGELAKRMGISRQAVSKAELKENNITTDKVSKFAKALNCTESYLMGWEVEPSDHARKVMANNIQHYMEVNGVTASKVCADLNIAPATFSDWIHGKTFPRIDKIELLANYFGIAKYNLLEDSIQIDFVDSNGNFIERTHESVMHKTAMGLFGNLSEEQQKMIIDLMKNMK